MDSGGLSTYRQNGRVMPNLRRPTRRKKLFCRVKLCGVSWTLRRWALHLRSAKGLIVATGNVTSAGWQVILCDPIWHVSSRSGEASR